MCIYVYRCPHPHSPRSRLALLLVFPLDTRRLSRLTSRVFLPLPLPLALFVRFSARAHDGLRHLEEQGGRVAEGQFVSTEHVAPVVAGPFVVGIEDSFVRPEDSPLCVDKQECCGWF